MIHCLRLTVEIMAGTDIDIASKELAQLAAGLNCEVGSTFNGQPIYARPWDSAAAVASRWHRTYHRPEGT